MRIINTIESISDCFVDGQFKMSAWDKYVEENHLNIKEICKEDIKNYNFDNDVLPVLNNVIKSKEKLTVLHNSFSACVDVLSNELSQLFAEEIDLDIILYLGLCNGAGWATTIDDRNVILLGIEKIIELDWQDEVMMKSLIFHEIGHIWHNVCGNLNLQGSTQDDQSLVQLYQEGVAMRCEQLLIKNENFYHQDKNDWLTWCNSNFSSIKQEYQRRIQNSESTQDFFGDWCNYKGYSDVGYYLGCRFIKFSENHYTLSEIINLNIVEVKKLFDLFVI
ncbi:MAG: hypothetical protein R3Y57_01625 [Erysipelotrichaceae bacterium]